MSVALTTIDNPFHPFNEFDLWLKFDKLHCYNSSELLDRFVRTSDALSDADQELAYEEAIDHIVESEWLNPLGVYIKFKTDPHSDKNNTPPSNEKETPTISEKDLPNANVKNFEDKNSKNYYSETFYKNFKDERDLIRSQDETF